MLKVASYQKFLEDFYFFKNIFQISILNFYIQLEHGYDIFFDQDLPVCTDRTCEECLFQFTRQQQWRKPETNWLKRRAELTKKLPKDDGVKFHPTTLSSFVHTSLDYVANVELF